MTADQKIRLGAIPLSPDILGVSNIGLWAFELDEGEEPRMYVDDAMLRLLGLEHQVSPEETYHAWYDHVDKDSYDLVNDAVAKMRAGEHSEVQYPWHHPDGHTIIVRCGGVVNPAYTKGIRIEGTHQDVSEVLHFDYADLKRKEEAIRAQQEQIELQRTLEDGLAREYHTVWLMDGFGDHKLHLYRTTGKKTVMSAVQLGLDEPCYDTSVVKYIHDNIVEEDQERVLEESKFETIARETPEIGTYVVSYRRYNADHTGYDYHQMCYAKAVARDGTVNYILAYRDADKMLREQIEQQRLLQDALTRQKIRLDQIKGLAGQFSVLYFVNLNTLETENYYLDNAPALEDAKDIDDKAENFFEAFKNSMVVYAHPDFKEEMLKYSDPSFVKNTLKDKRRHDYRFLCMDASGSYSWTDMVLMKFSDREDDEPVHIAVGYYNTDAEMRERLDASRRQERDLEAIRGLANEFDTLHFVDLEHDSYSMYYLTEDSPEAAKELADESKKFSAFHAESMRAFCHPDFMDQMLKFADASYIRQVLRNESKFTCRFLCNSDKGYQWCEFAVIRLDHEDVTKRVALGYTNINEMVETEIAQQKVLTDALSAAEAASHAKTLFLNSMSHDIRTPMNAILGYTSMAKKYIDDKDRATDYLNKIGGAGNNLLELVNQVLDMSRIESGTIVLADDPVDIIDKAYEMTEIFKPSANTKNVKLTTVINQIADRKVYADCGRVNQVIMNILGNATKYTPQGGSIKYSVSQIPCDRPGYATYVFSVKDTGIGISKEFLDKIFEPFTRENSSTVSKIQGTGLGMAIVKKLVDLMGGTINIESEPGKGTEMSVTLTLRLREDEASAVSSKGDESTPDLLKGKKVLLVEDNEMNREIATVILEEHGMVVETAEDGDVAVEKMKALAANGDWKHYDYVLMDIMMPRMNGYDAARAIRAIPGPRNVHVPIIAMTANAFSEDRRLALDSGMDAHIAKPIDVFALLETLTKYA